MSRKVKTKLINLLKNNSKPQETHSRIKEILENKSTKNNFRRTQTTTHNMNKRPGKTDKKNNFST